MSANLRPSKLRLIELPVRIAGVRPMRCRHCFHRQFSIVNPLFLLAIGVFHRVDAVLNLLQSEARQSHLSRTKRRKKKRRNSARRDHDSPQTPSTPAS